ncbi:hypothetical protein DMENIID0001_006880 [Sergentomyia squamirostris]
MLLFLLSGYKVRDFFSIAVLLNNGLHKKLKDPLTTIKKKYSHKIFHEVSKKPLIKSVELMGNHVSLKEFAECA